MELNMINIIYAALPMREQTKTTSAKLYIYIGVGLRDLFIDEAQDTRGVNYLQVFSLVSGHAVFWPHFFLLKLTPKSKHFLGSSEHIIMFVESVEPREWDLYIPKD